MSPFARLPGFYHAVDWSEPWLKGLLAFHVTVWVLAIATRRLNDVQIVLLLSICAPHSPCLCTAGSARVRRRVVPVAGVARRRARPNSTQLRREASPHPSSALALAAMLLPPAPRHACSSLNQSPDPKLGPKP